MGITIHYSGRLRDDGDYLTVTGLGRAFAHRHEVVVFELDVVQKELNRVKDGKVKRYMSAVRGISFCIHPQAEPVILQFDSDNYLQEFCKTQNAGVATHLKILNFLHEIEPYFKDFTVLDEGGYWGTGRLSRLKENFARMSTIPRDGGPEASNQRPVTK